jgi:hypothetical protein
MREHPPFDDFRKENCEKEFVTRVHVGGGQETGTICFAGMRLVDYDVE